jgi:hypothetical protein
MKSSFNKKNLKNFFFLTPPPPPPEMKYEIYNWHEYTPQSLLN